MILCSMIDKVSDPCHILHFGRRFKAFVAFSAV